MRTRRTRIGAVVLALVVGVAVVIAGVAASGGAAPAWADDDPVLVRVTGADGVTAATFTMSEIQALPVYEGYSGMINSAGTVTPPKPVRGVRLTDVLAAVGGVTTADAVDVKGSDGYGMTFTYGEVVNGTFQMYNETTREKEPRKADSALLLIYEYDGAPLPPDEGPLRSAVAQETNVHQLAEAHCFVKQVASITVRGKVTNWTVKMLGLKRKNGKRPRFTLDRKSYDSCSTPGCHGSAWTDPSTRVNWTGVPLFLCIGYVDGGRTHGYGAYNERLAWKGYRIRIVSRSGKKVVIDSRTIMNRERIILANRRQGSELTAAQAPLRLVGPRIGSRRFIKQIKSITLLPKRK